MTTTRSEPERDCPLCPRLNGLRAALRESEPGWFNAPVPSFGALDAPFLIVGLAPGVRGANRTGRPFTGDYAGVLLYRTLQKFGLVTGTYDARPDDGVAPAGCRITNAVRCVPPENLPTPKEAATCNRFLAAEIAAMPHLRAILTLGLVSHAMTLRALGLVPSRTKFVHGAIHEPRPGLKLFNSYHVSRYNTNTGRLTTEMFEAVVSALASM